MLPKLEIRLAFYDRAIKVWWVLTFCGMVINVQYFDQQVRKIEAASWESNSHDAFFVWYIKEIEEGFAHMITDLH